MPAPATADSFLQLLDRSGLLTAETVDQYRANAGAPRQLADTLVRDRLITPFQARQLLSGRHRGFFLTDKYKVLDLLGEGGMGRVLLCEHLILHKLQAVKVLTGADEVPGAQERFLREARALAALDHPNIARVFDVDRTPTGPFLVMEYVDGTNLHHLVAQHGPVDPKRAAGFAQMAALGLHHAHRAGLIHRDIKPGNLMLARDGNVKLLDLGLARFFDTKRNQNLTRRFDAKNVLGTADFIAPEQAVNSSNVDIRADIYSLGCTLYYLLTGRFPFPDGQPLEKLVWHQTKSFDPIQKFSPGVPDGLVAVYDRMVRKDPGDRYQTPEAAAEALSEWAGPPMPPPAHEMPRVKATSYQLGLSPPPSTTNLYASPTSPVRRTEPTSDSDLTTDMPAQPDPARTPRTSPTVTGAPPPPSVPTVSPPTAPHPRSRWPWMLAELLAVVAAAVGVWVMATRNRPTDVASAPIAASPPTTPANPPLVVAGSTFVRPLIEHWADVYAKETGQRIDYKPIGSPRGVAQMAEQLAAVGLTDVPLTDEQLRAAEKVGGPVVQVPLAFGAVAVAYSLPDAGPEPIKLSGPILADLYHGKVARWNDPGLVAQNPGRHLPPTPVVPIRRADGSGTTALFTGFLKVEKADWPATATGTDPVWPYQVREAKGNDGLAAEVSRTTGAIGYVELTLAKTRSLAVAALVNEGGKAVLPSVAGIKAALDGADIRPDPKFTLIDRPGPDTYPLVGATWAVAYEKGPGGRGPELAAFLRWATGEGQKHTTDLHFAPLPGPLAARVRADLDRIK